MRFPPGPAAGRRHPAHHRELGHLRVAQPQEVGDRERVRIGEHRAACRAAAARRASPRSRSRRRSGSRRARRPSTRPAPKRAANTERPGPSSTSTAPPATPTSGAADEDLGFEQLAQTARDVLERPDVMRRGEANEEVRTLAVELLDDLARDLADGLDRSGMQRERGRVAVHEIHALADSTPDRRRVERDHGQGQGA